MYTENVSTTQIPSGKNVSASAVKQHDSQWHTALHSSRNACFWKQWRQITQPKQAISKSYVLPGSEPTAIVTSSFSPYPALLHFLQYPILNLIHSAAFSWSEFERETMTVYEVPQSLFGPITELNKHMEKVSSNNEGIWNTTKHEVCSSRKMLRMFSHIISTPRSMWLASVKAQPIFSAFCGDFYSGSVQDKL